MVLPGLTHYLGTLSGGAPSLPPGSPLDLPALNRWYDASDAATITLVGSEVSALADKSPNAYHLSQPNAARYPSVGGTINGVDALTFDGVDEFLYRDSDMGGLVGTDLPWTAFIVIEPSSVAAAQHIFAFNLTGAGNAYQSLMLSTSALWQTNKRDDSNVIVSRTGGTPFSGRPVILTMVHKGTTTELRCNGAVIIPDGASDVGACSVSRFTLGSWFSSTTISGPFNGKIGEFILCSDDLGITDIEAMENYLSAKWGITIPVNYTPFNLPALNRWYDPSDAATITESGGVVSALNDKTPNVFHLGQSDATRRPLTGGSINGVAALTYDGSNDFLFRNSDLAAFTGEDKPHTAFIILEPAAVQGQYFYTFNNSSGGAYQSMLMTGSGPSFSYRKLPNSGDLVDVMPNKTPKAVPSLITVIHTGTSITIRWNGEEIVSGASSNVSTQTQNRMTLGAHFDSSTVNAPFNGKIGEFILCASALGSFSVDNAEAYLMDKWGITPVVEDAGVSVSSIKPVMFVSPGRTRQAVSSVKAATFIELAPRAELVVNFTGTDGSTTFSDLSPQTKTLTAVGNAQILSNKLELDGTGDYVTIPDSDAFALGRMDFTIEAFGVEFDVIGGITQTIIGKYNASGNQREWILDYLTTNELRFLYSVDGTATAVVSVAWTPVAGTPYDIAVVRSGTSYYLYVDGTRIHSATVSVRHIFAGTSQVGIGSIITTNVMNGRMKAIRVTSREAKYTGASYTVPTLPLT